MQEGAYKSVDIVAFLQQLLRQIPGKLLYGSDFPNGDPREMVAGFKGLQLGKEFLDRFLGGNARRLLRL